MCFVYEESIFPFTLNLGVLSGRKKNAASVSTGGVGVGVYNLVGLGCSNQLGYPALELPASLQARIRVQ